MVMSRNQNAVQNYNIKIDNKCFEKMEQFKHLRTTLINPNSIQEEIKSRLKSGNACYDLVQDLLSSSMLSKNTKIKIYRTIILLVVLYGCETWFLTLREEHRLRVFKHRVQRKILGCNMDELTREWRRLHNEELYDLYTSYYSGDQIKTNEMDGACGTPEEQERCIQGFGGETCGKRPLGRHRHRWEDNLEIDLQEVELRGMGWIDLAQDRDRWWALVNSVMNLQVP
jgi:hypothetical protein